MEVNELRRSVARVGVGSGVEAAAGGQCPGRCSAEPGHSEPKEGGCEHNDVVLDLCFQKSLPPLW